MLVFHCFMKIMCTCCSVMGIKMYRLVEIYVCFKSDSFVATKYMVASSLISLVQAMWEFIGTQLEMYITTKSDLMGICS